MTTRVWEGQAPEAAQITWSECTGVTNGVTYGVVVNGETVVEVTASGTTTALQLAQALASGWNAATGNAYARPLSATGFTTGGLHYFQLTADIAGNPFTYATTADGAGGFSAAADRTANASPNDWANAANWSGGAVPVTGDDVIFRDSSAPILWNIDQNATDLASLIIEQSYTGFVGHNQRTLVTGAAGAASSGKPEYHEDYLKIGWDECRIGEIIGPTNAGGSGRLKLSNTKAGASTTTIFNTAAGGRDANQPNVRLLLAHASADLFVRSGSGGVGVAIDDPAETTTCGDVTVSDVTTASRVFVGEGTTLTSWTQQGGSNELRAAAAVGTVSVLGGQLTLEGSFAVTTLNADGGTVHPHNAPSAGAAITTLNIDGGAVDARGSREARTWATVNLGSPGSSLAADSDVVTITTLNAPTGPYEAVIE